MKFSENIIGRAKDWVQGRLPQGEDRAVAAKVLRGHLTRLRERAAELEASLAYPDPVPEVAANLINGVRREVDLLATQASGDAEVAVPPGLFYRLIDAVVLGVDSQDEGVRKSGRELFNATIRDLPLMLAAEEEAVSACNAYARGNDLPRLLVGALARLRDDLNATAGDLIPKIGGRTPTIVVEPQDVEVIKFTDWFKAHEERHAMQRVRLAAADAGNRISLEEWERRFQEANPTGVLSGRPERIHLTFNAKAGMLVVKVHGAADALEGPTSRELDGWNVRVMTGTEPAPRPQAVAEGKALFNIGGSLDPNAFAVQFAAPRTQQWVVCAFYGNKR